MRLASRRIVLFSALLSAAVAWAEESPATKATNAVRKADAAWRLPATDPAGEGARAQALSTMREALQALEAQNSRRAAGFAAAASRSLPAKAVERLVASRSAYAASYERLAAILRQLVAEPPPFSLESARPELLAEAVQILARLETSASQKPISQSLPVGSPALQPPPIGVPSGTITTVPIGAIPASLQAAADALPGVVEVYESVRNGTAAEFYYGVMKGSAETYREQSGNDADTAAVLTQMIRAKGVPARYVRGVVQLKAAAFVAMTGAANIEQAVRVYDRAGIPHKVILGAGSVASVEFERVWVEAYVPYANYRGSMLDAQGKAWIPLDAGFKTLAPPRGVDAVGLGFDASATFADYLSAARTQSPLEFVKATVTSLLGPGQTYSSLLNVRQHAAQVSGLLPNSLPYQVVSVIERTYDLPDSLHHTVRLIATLNGETILDDSVQTEDAVGKRFTLGWAPATAEESALVSSYGGLLRTPPYLIEVRPILSIGGIATYFGSKVPMGVAFDLRMEVRSPGGTSLIENRVLAGNTMALGLGGAVQVHTAEGDSSAAQILSGLALRYFDSWNASDNALADLLHVIPVRPTVSVCLVSSDIEVEYADGDALLPVAWEWKGLFIDADLRATSPVGVSDPDGEKRFIQLSGLEGSILENRVFEDAYQIPSLSTARVLGMAASQGIEILDLTGSNANAIDTLPFDGAVRAEVQDAVQRGRRVTIPAAPVTYLAWTGVGYLIQDDSTLSAAYQLQGGHSGGVTAPSVIEIPSEFADKFKDPTGEPVVGDPDSIVGSIEIVSSRNFQIGTVGKASKEPLRVFVTDRNGFPLANAAVTFGVLGGGGSFANVLGVPVGPTATVVSDKEGFAETPFIFGTRTGEIPRYLAPGEGQEHSTQVGLNLVTAVAGSVLLDEPFTLFGAPDLRSESGQAQGDIRIKAAHGGGWLSNLRVAGRVDVSVTDQYDNPLSNAEIVVTARVAEREPGLVYARDLIPDFGGVLNQTDYGRCLTLRPTIYKGTCEGEAPTLTIRSSALGVFAFPVVGASTRSFYRFDIGTPLKADLLWVEYATVGTVCVIGPCPPLPLAYTSATTRGIWRNEFGDEIEAYDPGTQATMSFFTDVVREKERVVLRDGKYYVEGTNEWIRERLDGSKVLLTAKTPGTLVPAVAAAASAGEYTAPIRMAGTPQRNTVDYEVKAYAFRPLLTPDGDVLPQYVDTDAMRLKPEGWWQDAARPEVTRSTFSLWSATAAVQDVQPSPLVLTPTGTVAEASKLLSRIEPPEYKILLAPSGVSFEVSRLDPPSEPGMPRTETPVLSGVGISDFTIPVGLTLPPADYRSVLRVPGVALTAASKDIVSLPLDTPACPLVSLETREVKLSLVRDPVNDTYCGSEAKVRFKICRDSRVTLKVDGLIVTGGVDGSEAPIPVADLPLQAGEHIVLLPTALLGQTLGRSASLIVSATALSNSSLQGQDEGRVFNEVENRASLPVGHTFVKGVDVFDGHLVQQAADLSARGRHLGLEVTRTYSSTRTDSEGLLGAGWSFNYESRVFATSCAVIVKTADGGSQSFTPLADGGFRAQKGYHSKLRRNPDGSYDFTDKAGAVSHFREPVDATSPFGTRRLEWIREPHGDELRFVYDARNRLESVAEWHPEATQAVRSLRVTYIPDEKMTDEFDRIARLEIHPHGTSADFDYDNFGNLSTVITSTGLKWTYGYTATDSRDRHQLISLVDPNGAGTEFSYFGQTDPFPGEQATSGGASVVLSKEEFVKQIREFAQKGSRNQVADTRFAYDYTEAGTGTFKTTVSDPLRHHTTYTSDSGGAVTLIEEPESRRTVITWKAADILKASETDPNQRLTEYDYDANGNRILERVHAPGIGLVETVHEYEPAFNRMIYSRDAEGRETRYEIDPTNGDLRSVTDALLNQTVNTHDDHGQLLAVRDPRGNVTEYRDHTSYGDPQTVEDALGNVSTRVYDARGRLTDETDTLGRSRTLTYDDQDRVLSHIRRAGGGAGNLDEVTSRTYYPLGQVETETNANQGTTRYILDGMNRVVRTETPSGSVLTQWNDDGTKQSEQDRRGVKKTFEYDGAHRLKKVTLAAAGASPEGPVGEIAYFEYDQVGNKTLERDHGRRVTGYEYDGLYRVERKVLPLAPYFEEYAYDKVGNRLSAKDPNGHETRMEYDALNRVTSVRRDPEGLNLTTLTEYNDPGVAGTHVNKSAEIDATRGLRTEFLYDELNRERERRVILQGEDGDPATSEVTYLTTTSNFDSQHAVTVRDARGNATEMRMDGLDRVVTRSQLAVCGAGQPACAAGTPANLTTEMAYDGLGNKVRETDPVARVKEWFYDEQGRLITATDFAGTTSYRYDGEGLKTYEKNRRDIEREFTYDNLGRPRTERLVASPLSGVPWSRETAYLDVLNNWRRVEKDARGNETVFHLDALGRETKAVDPYDFFTETKWDGVNKREEKDKRLNKTLLDYDAADRLVRTTDPAPFEAQTVEITYDDPNNRKTEEDRRGSLTVTQSDALGRALTVTRSGVRLERNAYDENSNKVLGEDAEGKKTTFAYDWANRLVAQTNGAESVEAATTRFVLDGSGNKTAEIDPRSTDAEPSTRYVYDGANRQTDVFNGEGDQTHTEFDGEGNRLRVTPPAQPPTTYAWDELDKLTKVTQPATADHGPAETSFGYDENRNKTRQTTARGFATTYVYDKLNRLESITEPAVAPAGPLVTGFEYDPNGNARLVTDPKGQTETTTYDELNRKTRAVYAAAPGAPALAWREVRETRYDYDENSNPTGAHEYVASGSDPPMIRSVVKAFDNLDRVEIETTTLPDGGTKALTYEYFENGTRKALIDPQGLRTEYTYDGKNRVQTMVTEAGTPQAQTTNYAYFADDLLRQTLDPNGVSADRTYDKADRLKTLANTRGATLVSSYAYVYDTNGNRTSQVETNLSVTPPPPAPVTPAEAGVQAPETTLYAYDEANRLRSVTYPADTTYPFGRVVTYHYDKAGNREREVETLPPVIPSQPTLQGAPIIERIGAFDANNRLTSLTTTAAPPTVPASFVPSSVTPAEAGAHFDSTLLITYDDNGNELSRTRTLSPADGGTVTTTLSTWDLKDRLVEQTKDGAIITRHEYDAEGRRTKKIGEEGIRQYVYDDTSLLAEYNSSGLEVAKYDYGADRLIRLTRADEGTRYMTFDGLGNVTGLTNPSGDVTATYHLDAWGNYRFTSELETSHNRFGFTGHYWDKEASLYYAKARYYDPFTARFTQADSFLGRIDDPPSLHRYFYAADNPTFYVDPTGHDGVAAGYSWFYGVPQRRVEETVQPLVERVESGLADVGMGISIAAANLLKGLNSPGHMTPEAERRYYVQPENQTEKVTAQVVDIVATAAPLMGTRLREAPPALIISEVKTGASTAGSRPVGATQPVTIVEGKSGGTFALSDTNRPIYAGGKLRSAPAARDLKSQAQLPGKAPGDHAGHMLASRFGFEGEGFNLTPMAPKLNLSAFKKLENLWNRLKKQGHEVEVHVFAVHKTNPNRADQFAVAYSVDGGQPVMTVLDNPLPKTGKTSNGATVH